MGAMAGLIGWRQKPGLPMAQGRVGVLPGHEVMFGQHCWPGR